MSDQDFTPQLQSLMQRVGITSFKSLSQATGVSKGQILSLRRGKLTQMRIGILSQLAAILQISLTELIETFTSGDIQVKTENFSTVDKSDELVDLKKEYERVVLQLEQQRETLQQEFQQSSLQVLESLLLFWPTAAQKAQENPQLEAIKILALVQKPLDKLLQAWGVEAIATVGEEIPYNPQWHELFQGTAQVGEIVKVCYIGYRQGNKLLYRAKVSPL